MSSRAAFCFLLASAPAMFVIAQERAEPEVRRALPVDRSAPDPSNYQNPDWVRRVPPAPAASSTPVSTPIPVATPIPFDRSKEGSQVPFRPERRTPDAPSFRTDPGIQGTLSPLPADQPAPPAAPPAAPADEAGTIRLGPSGAGQAGGALDRANSLYARKMYDLAIPEFEMALVASAPDKARDAALFRLAECHRMLGNSASARSGYEKLVSEFRKGEFAGAGAYRLGEVLFAEKLYEASASQFATAATEAKEPEVRLAARYFLARSLDYLKRPADAREAYQAVVAVTGKNPYRNNARMALADLDVQEGKKTEAFAALESLAKEAKDPAVVAEASVKAASLAAELHHNDKALALFQQAADETSAPEWIPIAVVGALRMRYQAADFKGIAKNGIEILEKVPPETRPEVLQILATAQRQQGNNQQARQLYERLLKDYPDAAPARDAAFQRLVSLYALKDKGLVAEIDAFLDKTTDPKARTQAMRLKAETLFKQADYVGAGKAYAGLLERNLPDEQNADVLYKAAWCLAAVEKHKEAMGAYSGFLDKYPTHALAASALARRAQSKQQCKEFEAAIQDFDLLISKYPESKERELALLQKALIYGQQKKYDAMAESFNQLLKEYPKTAAAAQANFWLGWAAFEQKDYKTALGLLEKARSLDAAQYGERAGLRIILAHYYLEDRAAVVREAAAYKGGNLPAEISLWLAAGWAAEGKYDKAEAVLLPLTKSPGAVSPDVWINLAEAQIRLGKFKQARGPADRFLEAARDPATRARALIASARVCLGENELDEASQQIEEAMLLQPEGRLNAEARLASGDVLVEKSDFDGAARAYMTVSVLTNDPVVAPRALQLAAGAYRRANNKAEADKALAELQQRFPDFQKNSKPDNI